MGDKTANPSLLPAFACLCALACFCGPFVTIHCNGEAFSTCSGMQLLWPENAAALENRVLSFYSASPRLRSFVGHTAENQKSKLQTPNSKIEEPEPLYSDPAGFSSALVKFSETTQRTSLLAFLAVAAGLLGMAATLWPNRRALAPKIQLGAGAIGAVCLVLILADGAQIVGLPYLHLRWPFYTALAACVMIVVCTARTVLAQVPPGGEFRVGTLTYTRIGLVTMFTWMLWGDFCWSLMESVFPAVFPLQLKTLGATDEQLSLLMGVVPSVLCTAVVPVISFKSDRYRSRWGRRIPFMVVTAPFLCICLVSLAYSKEIAEYIRNSGWVAASGLSPMTAALLAIGLLVTVFQFFNDFVNSVYWYLFADVIPEQFMGRFSALFRLMGILVSYVWNTFIFRYAETHTKEIYWGMALLYFVGFGLMCWRVKEGEYPPLTDIDAKQIGVSSRVRGAWKGFKLFFKECFSDRFFILYFLFTMTIAVSDCCTMFRIFFFKDVAGLSLEQIGRVNGWSAILSGLLCLPTGWLVDRITPMRTMLLAGVLHVPVTLMGFFIHDFPSFVYTSLLMLPISAMLSAAGMPLNVQLMPKDRFGQFCSANAMVRSFGTTGAMYVAGVFMTWVKDYRYVWVWAGGFRILAYTCLFLVFLEWRRRERTAAGAGTGVPVEAAAQPVAAVAAK